MINSGCQWVDKAYVPSTLTLADSIVQPTIAQTIQPSATPDNGKVVLAEVFTYDE